MRDAQRDERCSHNRESCRRAERSREQLCFLVLVPDFLAVAFPVGILQADSNDGAEAAVKLGCQLLQRRGGLVPAVGDARREESIECGAAPGVVEPERRAERTLIDLLA